MSIESWKKEFYEVEAKDVPVEPLAATIHSLLKWQGLTAENLAKHRLIKLGRTIGDDETGERFYIDSDRCALCQQYVMKTTCVQCPLALYLGAVNSHVREGCREPYKAFTNDGNPQPMIQALQGTRDMLLNEIYNAPHSP